MYFSRTRKMKVNMGNYESYDIEATVGLSAVDIGYSEQDLAEMDRAQCDNVFEELRITVLDRLEDVLVHEVMDAVALSLEPDSFVLRAQRQLPKPPPKPQPAAATTSRRVIHRAH